MKSLEGRLGKPNAQKVPIVASLRNERLWFEAFCLSERCTATRSPDNHYDHYRRHRKTVNANVL